MNNRLLLQLIIFLFILLISSCRKVGNGYLEGHVFEIGYNTPIVNMPLKMVQLKNGGRGSYISGGTTNQDGYFKMKFQKKFAYTYEYFIDSDKYLYVEGADRIDYKKQKVSLFAMPQGFLKLTVKNNLNEDLDFYITSPYYGNKVRIKANQEQAFSLITINGYGETDINWHYITDPTKKTSDINKELVALYSKTDTVVKTIDIY